jgi:hypothetical protein
MSGSVGLSALPLSLRRVLLPLLPLAVFAAVPLARGQVTKPIEANLDSDPPLERLVVTEVKTEALTQNNVQLQDTCDGAPASYDLLSKPQDIIDRLRLVRADGHDNPDILVVAVSGASGRVGVAELERYDGCTRPKVLFSYDSTNPRPRPPRHFAVAGFRVSVRNLTNRFRGREIRLVEGLAGRHDALCCPSRRRESRLRYDRARDRYVRYAVTTRRVPAG